MFTEFNLSGQTWRDRATAVQTLKASSRAPKVRRLREVAGGPASALTVTESPRLSCQSCRSHIFLATEAPLSWAMFAVPGWSLSSASLKTQVDAPRTRTSLNDGQIATANGSKSRKKRKRGRPAVPGPDVTDGNVGDLWHQHIEGRIIKTLDGCTGPVATRDNKRRKVGPLDAGNRENITETVVLPQPQRSRNKLVGQVRTSEKDPSHNSCKEDRDPHDGKHDHTSGPNVSPPNWPLQSMSAPESTVKLTPLQASMRQKLTSARFRHLNQTLYTTASASSFDLFAQNPELFEEYHAGFRQQVAVWPENPVDGYVEELQKRGRLGQACGHRKGKEHHILSGPQTMDTGTQPLPRTGSVCTVADLGCGDAKLAQQLATLQKKLKLRILSFDLYSQNPSVTKADIANLPLKDGEVDIAIFCLALMGTNWVDFIDEAWRVLHWRGELWVAEIKSRFGRLANKRLDHSVGNKRKKVQSSDDKKLDDEAGEQAVVELDGEDTGEQKTDVSAFIGVLEARGFALQNKGALDHSNKMFVKMKFIKALKPLKGKNVLDQHDTAGATEISKKNPKTKLLDQIQPDGIDEASILKPCVYKLR